MKKAGKIVIISLMLVIFMGFCVYADEAVKVMEVQEYGENPVVFVKGLTDEVESAEALVGQVKCTNVISKKVSDEKLSIKTLILIDNSLSIPENDRDTVKNIIAELLASRSNSEQFALATFSESVNLQVDFTDDYTQLKTALDAVNYVDQETYLTDVLYDLISKGSFAIDEDSTYRRILVISDGVDNKSLGYTTEELSTLLNDSGVPIYTLGIHNKKKTNDEELKNMFALSRQTNADSILLEDIESPLSFANIMAADRDIIKFVIIPETAAKDGSKKTVTLNIHTGSGDITVKADDVRMVQEENQKEEPESELEKAEEVEETDEIETTELVEESNDLNPAVIKTVIIGGSVVIAVILLIVALILYLAKKKKENKIVFEEEDIFKNKVEEKTEMVYENKSETDSGTVQIWNQGRKYTIRLIDVTSPARSFQKEITDKLTIGRSAEKVDICIDYDKSVSSRHCVIEKRGEKFFLVDLQSSNGTFMNNNRVLSEVEIYSGNIIKMGRVQMRVEIG